MPTLILGMVLSFIVDAVPKSRVSKPLPLCAGCFHAHVQYTANAKRAISCTYGGGVRAMKLDVLYCTDYRARDAPSRVSTIGFVKEIVAAK